MVYEYKGRAQGKSHAPDKDRGSVALELRVNEFEVSPQAKSVQETRALTSVSPKLMIHEDHQPI